MVTKIIGFDVDGVLTKPEKRVPNPLLISFIVSQLDQSRPVGLITGRTPHWLKEFILAPIQVEIQQRSKLDFLFLSSEKATVKITFHEGSLLEQTTPRVKVPKDLWGRIKKLAKGSKDVFFDDKKVNIPSLEIVGGNEEQVRQQKETLKTLKRRIDKMLLNFTDFVVIDEPGIALDIQHKSVDKTNAALDFINFVEAKGVKNPNFIIFGDTISDVRLAQKIWEMNCRVSLAYVGIKEVPRLPFQVIRPQSGEIYDAGTISILRTLHFINS